MTVNSIATARLYALLAFCSLAIVMISGCGRNKFPVRTASGTVVCDGQPVTRGSITFTPIGESGGLETGKAASAALSQDGSFKLSTYGQFDGAIVGKHRVEFTSSEGDEEDESEQGDDVSAVARKKKSSQNLVLDQELILEVKASGENVFKIELSKSKS